jgi:hypothetical protein
MSPKMKTNFSHCLTLRITPEMDSMIVDAAYESRQFKANWIRGAILQRLARRRRTATSHLEEQTK